MTPVLPDVRLSHRMNNDTFQRILETLRSAQLTAHEKTLIRGQLQAYMREHPARAPFVVRWLDIFAFAAHASVLRPRFQLAAAALVLVFAVGGTSYAAERSLPGDPLYAVKIHMNEPIQGALAISPEAKAQWNAQLAARRLEEAEELAAQNKLDSSASATLAAGLDQASENFDASVAAFASSTGDVAAVSDLQSGMEATLAVHAQVLNQIVQDDPGAHVAVMPILSNVQSRVAAITGAQASLVARVVANTQAAQRVAESQRDVALGQLGQAQALISAKAGVNTGLSTSTDPDTLAAQTAIEAGDQHLAQGNYGAAIATFQAANLAAHEAKIRAYVENQIRVTPTFLFSTTTPAIEIDTEKSAPKNATTATDGASDPANATTSRHGSEGAHGEIDFQIGI